VPTETNLIPSAIADKLVAQTTLGLTILTTLIKSDVISREAVIEHFRMVRDVFAESTDSGSAAVVEALSAVLSMLADEHAPN
jgi:hypothetical protein